MTRMLQIEPIDVISPRGNMHFGSGSGEIGTGVFPPSPSVFAGALRSFLAARNVEVLEKVERGEAPGDALLGKVLGSAAFPGSFRITFVSCGRKTKDGLQPLFPLPQDVVVIERQAYPVTPRECPPNVHLSKMFPLIPVLRAPSQISSHGYYLTRQGWEKYLKGSVPDAQCDMIPISKMWQKEIRVGIGLNSETRSAEEGKLFNADYCSMSQDIVLLVGVEGADECLNGLGVLRLGGDGRGAAFRVVEAKLPEIPFDKIVVAGRFRLVLTTPGLFSGILPPRVTKRENDYILDLSGTTARLVCAIIPGYEVVSGWNLVTSRPKNAERAVPAGAVYWFDRFEGDPKALEAWVSHGLWGEPINAVRRAEGYNCGVLGAWLQEK